jgi:hypothetical protein
MGDEVECATEKTTRKYLVGAVDSTMWEFGYKLMGQQYRWSCWLASMRILYQWGSEQGKGISPDDCDKKVLAGTFGGDSAAFLQAQQTGLVKEKRGSAYGDVRLVTFNRATVLGWSLQELVTRVHEKGPMIFTMTIDQGGGKWSTHATVIRGASVPLGNVNILDPYDESAFNEGNDKKRAIPTIWNFPDYQSKFPPDGSVSADTLIGQLP